MQKGILSNGYLFCFICILLAAYNIFIPFGFKKLNLSYSCQLIAANGAVYDIKQAVPGRPEQIELDNFKEIKQEFIDCLLSTEDRYFFDSAGWNFGGVSWRGMGRMLLQGGSSGGGSGLVQQAVKNVFFDIRRDNRNFNKKYTEAITSFAVTSVYSRRELLRLYFNMAPVFGVRGFKTAALAYFGKSLKDLELHEFATLVGVLKGGRNYSTPANIKKIESRRDEVLDNMVAMKKLDERRAVELKFRPLVFRMNNRLAAGGFSDYVMKEAKRILKETDTDTLLSGLRIKTTVSVTVQTAAALAVQQLWRDTLHYPAGLETGLVCIEPQTGFIRAMIGDNNPYHFSGKLNHAADDLNQAGSILKPFVYAAAFEQKNWGPFSPAFDGDMKGYNPGNYNGSSSQSYKPVWECLKYSLNKPAAYMVNSIISENNVISVLRKCGITTALSNEKSIVLGVDDVKPVEIAAAYAVFAARGLYNPPVAITEIRSKENKLIWSINATGKKKKKPAYPRRALKASTADNISYCLARALEPGGTGSSVRRYYNKTAYGKTGTTQSNRDVWFAGYTPSYSTAIWIGYNDKRAMPPGYTGGNTAAPLWGIFMKKTDSLFSMVKR